MKGGFQSIEWTFTVTLVTACPATATARLTSAIMPAFCTISSRANLDASSTTKELRTTLPDQGIATRVENRDDVDSIVHLTKHDDVGEATQQGTACAFEGRRKLFGILRDAVHGGAQGVAKLRRNLRRVGVVPAESIDEVGPSRLRKKNPGHKALPAVKLGVDVFPGNGLAAVHVESRKPTIQFGLVRRG